MLTARSSMGCRRASTEAFEKRGSSSRKRAPPEARLISPGMTLPWVQPPMRAVVVML